MRVLLLHGAWAGPWVWDGLRSAWAGRRGITAVDLRTSPRDTDADLVDRILAALDAEDTAAILVAHSGAAALAMTAAHRRPETVRGLVSLAGIVLPAGADLAAACAEIGLDLTVGIGRYLEPSPGGTTVPPEAAAAVFFHDLDAEQAVSASRRLVPQAAAALSHVADWSAGTVGTLPHLYVEATLDRSLPLELQRHLAARVGVTDVATLACGHAVPVARPRQVRQLVSRFVTVITQERSRCMTA
ncbi:alpha/beta fold hydrolase [Nocardioides sp.]|uniref:alpha/beta fold hydrolase n=1 Tax=Nocardioides sp. TaxID=35761 RepID=UPI0039E6ABDA